MLTIRFYDTVRPRFGGHLSQAQVDGMELIAGACADARCNRQATAYIFATAFHETGGKMRPVAENLNYSAARLREVWPNRFTAAEAEQYAGNAVAIANRAYGGRMGNGPESSGDGWVYRGRGLVQITGRDNYRRLGAMLGVDLESDPELALDPAVSARILVEGMRTGAFTGISLDDVAEPETMAPDFVNDRSIVNAQDRAQDIARHAQVFHEALRDVDLLAKSRTVRAAKGIKAKSIIGAIASGGVVIMETVRDVLVNEQGAVIEAAQSGTTLARLLDWAPATLALLAVGLFLWQRVQAARAEAARRDDNETKGV